MATVGVAVSMGSGFGWRFGFMGTFLTGGAAWFKSVPWTPGFGSAGKGFWLIPF
jgi:hypothetical protein